MTQSQSPKIGAGLLIAMVLNQTQTVFSGRGNSRALQNCVTQYYTSTDREVCICSALVWFRGFASLFKMIAVLFFY